MDKKRILVAEDEESCLHPLVRILIRAGLDVTAVNDGDKVMPAIDDLARERNGAQFDLILCDIFMPGRGGIEVLDELRRQHGHIPVILMTGFIDESLQRHLKDGCRAIISKPFSKRELLEAIVAVLGPEAVQVEPAPMAVPTGSVA